MKRGTKVYIAGPYPLRNEMQAVMLQLEERGLIVTSSWLRKKNETSHEEAVEDLADVAKADVLLFIQPTNWENTGTGGRHVEFGYAVALGKEIVMLGIRRNVFHHLNHVRHIERLDQL